MSVLEFSPYSPHELVRGGMEQLRHAIGRISFRDTAHAQDRLLEPLAAEGQLRDAEPPVTLPPSEDFGPRLLQVATIRRRGLDQEVRLTTPLNDRGRSGVNILLRPGIALEPNAAGPTRELHDRIADAHKGAVVMTHGTPGVGGHASPLPFREAMRLRFETIADDQLEIAGQIFGDGPVDSINHSMGAMPGWLAAFQNMEKPRITYRSITSVNGALLPRQQAKRLVCRFALNKVKEVANALEGGYLEAITEGAKYVATVPYACYGNARWLLPGLEKDKMRAVSQRIPTLLLYSEFCNLAITDLYAELEANSGGNVVLREYKGQGHSVDGHMDEIVEDIGNFMNMGFLAAARLRRQEQQNSYRF